MSAADSSADAHQLFLEHLRFANPFDDNRVTQADRLPLNIPEIHAAQFEHLIDHAEVMRRNGSLRGRGVLVSGEPGIGKSHLLARFGDWARDNKYPFVYLLNLQAGAGDILRSILRTSVSILTRNYRAAPRQTRLFRLISTAINHAVSRFGDATSATAPDLQAASEMFERLMDDRGRSREVTIACWQFFAAARQTQQRQPLERQLLLARQWLMGDYLDSEEEAELGLPSGSSQGDVTGPTPERIKEVIQVLSEFAGYRGRAFILCFDQVDTLTQEQVLSWAGAVHALLDATPRLLVVTSGVLETFHRWSTDGWVQKASWDRIAQFSLPLTGLRQSIVRDIVQNRLTNSLTQFVSLPEVARHCEADALFPIGRRWEQAALFEESGRPKVDLQPRHILNSASFAWQQQADQARRRGLDIWLQQWPGTVQKPTTMAAFTNDQLRDVIDHEIEVRMQQHRDYRQLHPEELPPDDGHVLGLIRQMLLACQRSAAPWRTDIYGRLADFEVCSSATTLGPFQLIIRHHPPVEHAARPRIGFKVAHAHSGLAATNMLQRILSELNSKTGPERAILVVDGRAPLQLGTAGKEHLTALQEMTDRFTLITLDLNQYAELDALEVVAGTARSNDLEINLPDGSQRRLTAQDVYDSHHRHGRYCNVRVICDLLGNCSDAAVGARPPLMDVEELIAFSHTQLALNPGQTTLQLTNAWLTRSGAPEPPPCATQLHQLFRRIAQQMHDDGTVQVTHHPDYDMVLPKRQLIL